LATSGTALLVRKNLGLKITKRKRYLFFFLDYGMAVAALFILLSTIVFLYSAYGAETRYIAALDEPCLMDGDEYGQLKLCYVPYKVIVSVGDTVMWENVGSTVHTVTSGTLIEPSDHFNSGLIAPSNIFSLTFAVGGIYPYYCMVHPWMWGSVVVDEKITPEEKEVLLDNDDLIVILEDGQFQNATGVYWANGTAVVPEFPFAIIILVVTVTMVIVFSRQKVLTY